MTNPITIIGGGLAGLTLGIGLRQREVPVTVWEAGDYPRHRVCGEFISGEGQRTLDRLGLLKGLKEAGALEAHQMALFHGDRTLCSRNLPVPGLTLSRWRLDMHLSSEFRRLGGELRTKVRGPTDPGAGVVRTSGRIAELSSPGSWRWFGLKAHAQGVKLAADLEMHLIPSGYVGICRLAGGEVNVSGLFRSREAIPDLATRWPAWLRGPEGSVLHDRLKHATFDLSSFSSVAALNLRPGLATARDACCLGDALTMTPPITGNGMSMAFESAELAIDPIVKFHLGESDWSQTRKEIANRCESRFRRRLRWASRIQWCLFEPRVQPFLSTLVRHSNGFWRWAFASTRR